MLPTLLMAAGDADKTRYLIRQKFHEGQQVRYSLSVAGEGKWDPARNGWTHGKMSTDFTFTLQEKTLRQSSACTFDLLGEKLKSKLEGPDDDISVEGDREDWEVKTDKGKLDLDKRNPLAREMTITIGPRGRARYGTRLLRLVPFFAVHVDRHFWVPLTTAPRKEVGPGDAWEESFKVDLPDSRGRPLRAKFKAKVTGWQTYQGRRCLAGQASAKLDLKETWGTLRNGDRMKIDRGQYQPDGKVFWDVERGLLCFASARSRLSIDSSRPEKRRFSGWAGCELKLLGVK